LLAAEQAGSDAVLRLDRKVERIGGDDDRVFGIAAGAARDGQVQAKVFEQQVAQHRFPVFERGGQPGRHQGCRAAILAPCRVPGRCRGSDIDLK